MKIRIAKKVFKTVYGFQPPAFITADHYPFCQSVPGRLTILHNKAIDKINQYNKRKCNKENKIPF